MSREPKRAIKIRQQQKEWSGRPIRMERTDRSVVSLPIVLDTV